MTWVPAVRITQAIQAASFLHPSPRSGSISDARGTFASPGPKADLKRRTPALSEKDPRTDLILKEA